MSINTVEVDADYHVRFLIDIKNVWLSAKCCATEGINDIRTRCYYEITLRWYEASHETASLTV